MTGTVRHREVGASADDAPVPSAPGGSRSAESIGSTRSTRGALFLGGRQLLTILLSAAAAILLARWLQPADYGMFATLNMIVFGAATVFGDLGVTVSLVRQSDEPPVGEWAAAKRLLGGLSMVAGVGGAIGVVAVWASGSADLAIWVGALVVALIARFSRAVPSARLQRSRSFATLALIETAESVLYFSIVLTLARLGHGAGALAIAVGAKELIGVAAQLWAARGGPRTKGVDGHYRSLLSVGAPVQASGLAVAATDMFQPLFIGTVLGLTTLGHVTWAYNLTLMPILLLGAIDRVVLPSLARVQEDRVLLGLLTARALRLNALLAFPVVVAVMVAPSELVSLVFSDRWLPGADLLVLFMPAIVTTAVSSPLLHAFNAVGRTRVAMWLSIAWLVVTWTIGALVTARWAAQGFGFFYVGLQVMYLPIWWLAKRDLGVDVFRESRDAVLGLILGITAGASVASSLQPGGRWPALLIGIAVGEAVFAATMWLFENDRTRADVVFLVGGLTGRRLDRSHPSPIAEPATPKVPVANGAIGDDRPWRLAHVGPFDGLRALAVLGVMFHHAHLPWLDGGFLGVDVFFVLSGFLITALLVQERDRNGSIDFPRFYARRALRLFPALLVMTAVVVPVLLLWAPGELRSTSLATVPWSLAYLTNYLAMVVERSLGVFGHTWSLAIEEQFYVLWPPVLAALLARRSVRFAAVFAGVVAVAVAVGRAAVWLAYENLEYTYFPLHARADALLLGCLAALLMTGTRASRIELLGRRARPLALVAVFVLLAVAAVATTTAGWVYLFGMAVVAVSVTVLLAQIAADPTSRPSRVLAWKPLAFIGTISYGVYLWHFPVFELTKDVMPDLAFRYLVVTQFVVSFAAALASYWLIERPFLGLKRRFESR